MGPRGQLKRGRLLREISRKLAPRSAWKCIAVNAAQQFSLNEKWNEKSNPGSIADVFVHNAPATYELRTHEPQVSVQSAAHRGNPDQQHCIEPRRLWLHGRLYELPGACDQFRGTYFSSTLL